MGILILIFIGIALFHLVYEGIILPSLRFQYRFEYFKLRDDLRDLKFQYGDKLSDAIFNDVDETLSKMIFHIHNISFGLFYKAQRMINKDKELEVYLNKKMELINNCKIDELHKILDKSSILSIKLCVFNQGGWLIYILPIILIAATYKSLYDQFEKIIFFPNKDFERAISQDYIFAS